ncbi:ABC transporter ATP-binding protein [Acidovorax sp. LjRoot129]|uniref:ABC transporter ATP-binding protein n=1 Tax=Acidovorax sp. LjRoot129 TaxID=3342260 RepID=UPI003ECE40D7
MTLATLPAGPGGGPASAPGAAIRPANGTAATAGLQVEQLGKHYGETPVFAQVDFSVAPGEFVAIVGDSGVGKSTLLNCLAGLDTWDTGRVLHGGVDLGPLDDTQRALWRRAHVGFVFQAFHVLPHLDVAQNIALPLMLLGQPDPLRVQYILDAVGLADMGTRLPQQLSGGQLQRVAIARALVHRPALLLADEPTGNLDPTTAARVMDLLLAQTREHGASLVLVTHSDAAAARADRVLRLRSDGIAAGS